MDRLLRRCRVNQEYINALIPKLKLQVAGNTACRGNTVFERMTGLDEQIYISAALQVVSPRAEEPDPGVRAYIASDLFAYDACLILRDSHVKPKLPIGVLSSATRQVFLAPSPLTPV